VTAPDPPPADPVVDPVVTVACREFVELVTEHLEGTLPPAMEQAVAEHLELCDPCVEYLAQVRGTVGLLHTLPTATLPPGARDRLLAVFDRLHGAGG
jgi:anti-sigma factor ChrR (cupin superfamily)